MFLAKLGTRGIKAALVVEEVEGYLLSIGDVARTADSQCRPAMLVHSPLEVPRRRLTHSIDMPFCIHCCTPSTTASAAIAGQIVPLEPYTVRIVSEPSWTARGGWAPGVPPSSTTIYIRATSVIEPEPPTALSPGNALLTAPHTGTRICI